MIYPNCNTIKTTTIEDAWRESMWLCAKNGYDYITEEGSYTGQIRRQLDSVKIEMRLPGLRPLAPICPYPLPSPTDEEKINNYFVNYIMGSEKKENEVYTYGEFIHMQLSYIIDLLVRSQGYTNQATICIGSPLTTFLKDPPCLRAISFKRVAQNLNMGVYFRSWDLYTGLPENLGGLQLLKEYVLCMLSEKGLVLDDGSIIAFSDGLHIYEQYFPLVNTLCVDKIETSEKTLENKERYLLIHGK